MNYLYIFYSSQSSHPRCTIITGELLVTKCVFDDLVNLCRLAKVPCLHKSRTTLYSHRRDEERVGDFVYISFPSNCGCWLPLKQKIVWEIRMIYETGEQQTRAVTRCFQISNISWSPQSYFHRPTDKPFAPYSRRKDSGLHRWIIPWGIFVNKDIYQF